VRRYAGMTSEEFLDYLLDENGLAHFVDVQLKGVQERTDQDWQDVTLRIWYLSDRHWQPTPEYVRDLYAMQKARLANDVEVAA
jgi:hypothetical protein